MTNSCCKVEKRVVKNTVMSWKEYYDYFFYEMTDPRSRDWPLLQDPYPALILTGLYLYFVLYLGPKLMQNRQPFYIPNILKFYNALQVVLNSYLVYEFLDAAWLKYSWKCEPVDYSDTPEAIRIARVIYIYFLVKVVDLFDTIFFVLRKKNNHISLLHVYHHAGMVPFSWVGVKFIPGGHLTFMCPINSLVHVIMYFYYFMSSLGPKYQKYLWWKKHMTAIQLIQFVIVFLHSLQLLFYDCGFPRLLLVAFVPNNIYIYYLFRQFYLENYTKKGQVVANASPGETEEYKKTS